MADKRRDLSEAEKPTINAPAESLPIEGETPAPDLPTSPDDNPLAPQQDDGGQDALSGLPRNSTSEQVSKATQKRYPDTPIEDVPDES